MKIYILLPLLLFCILPFAFGQNYSIAADRFSVFYVGMDNPISVAVENLSCKSIIVKATNGKIEGKNGHYTVSPTEPGVTTIILYKKTNGKIKEIGRGYFRVKKFPDPIFKIGSGHDRAPIPEITNQQYVRAEFDGDFNIDVRYSIEKFTVCFISADPCQYIQINNEGNKINDEIKSKLMLLKPSDILIFKNIICSGPDGKMDLRSRMITVY